MTQHSTRPLRRLIAHLVLTTFLPLILPAAETYAPEPPGIFELTKPAPLIRAQEDGVLYLNPNAAAIVSKPEVRTNIPAQLLNFGNTGGFVLNEGRIAGWGGDSIRPYWRVLVPAAGRYRVVILRANAPGRESAAQIHFWYADHAKKVERPIESSGAWTTWSSYEMGEVELAAGEALVEYRPTAWIHPQYLINLSDVRLLPLSPVETAWKDARVVVARQKLNSQAEFGMLVADFAACSDEAAVLRAQVLEPEYAKFTEISQFAAVDRAKVRLKTLLDTELPQLQQRLHTALLDLAKALEAKSATDAATLRHYVRLASELAAAPHKEYPKIYFTQDGKAPAAAKTGSLSALYPSNYNPQVEKVTLELTPAPDAAARRQRFQERDSAQAIERLAGELHAALKPGIPGLEMFGKLFREGKFREALDAYRDYFFAKFSNPEYQKLWPEKSIETGFFRDPPDELVKMALAGTFACGRGKPMILGKLGIPGEVYWAPDDLALPGGVVYGAQGPLPHPFWKSPEGQIAARKIQFFRALNTMPQSGMNEGLFAGLLQSYFVSGNAEHLSRWCQYADDWCMNAKADLDNSPVNIRAATELEAQEFWNLVRMFYCLNAKHLELRRQFPATTLARLLLKSVAEFPPYTIRMKRAQQSNWGIIGIQWQLYAAT
ncbi:MAG: hypothetical protein WCP55_17960, partial [Lentisphaerota bacterium]